MGSIPTVPIFFWAGNETILADFRLCEKKVVPLLVFFGLMTFQADVMTFPYGIESVWCGVESGRNTNHYLGKHDEEKKFVKKICAQVVKKTSKAGNRTRFLFRYDQVFSVSRT